MISSDSPAPLVPGLLRPSSQYDSHGPLRVVSRDDTVALLRAEEAAKRPKPAASRPVSALVTYLLDIARTNQAHKRDSGVQEMMMANLRARRSLYDETKLNAINSTGGCDLFMGLTGVKCRAAEAWILDILASPTERSWSISPTPLPDPELPIREKLSQLLNDRMALMAANQQQVSLADANKILEELREGAEEDLEREIRRATARMEKKIHDQLVEGGWAVAFQQFVSDLVTMKAGVIKGPIPRIRRKRMWKWDPDSKKNIPSIAETVVPVFMATSPLDLFPSPDSTGPHEGSLVERCRFSRSSLIDLKDQPGYRKDAIDSLLRDFSIKASASTFITKQEDPAETEREDLEYRDKETFVSASPEICEGFEFWCPVQGKMLKDAEITEGPNGETLEDLAEYEINAIVIGDQLVYASLYEAVGLDRPYHVSGWAKEPGSFWYQGIPELMQDLQRVCNAAMRAAVDNMADSAGTQVEVDISRLPPGHPISIRPRTVWQTKNVGNLASPAVRFFQPKSVVADLMAVYDNFARLADEYTGVPAYSYGNERAAGAGRTFSGLSALMSAAARGIKRVLLDVDENVVKEVVRRLYDWNRKYYGDDFKGDVDVVTTGIMSVIVREQQADRRIQFLNVTNNPVDQKIVGILGRAAILRETAEALEIPGADIIGDREQLQKILESDEASQAQMAQAQTALAQLEMQLKQAEIQSKLLEMQLRQQEFQLKAAQIQAESEQKGVDLRIKSRKVEAEALKDVAVAADLGLKGLMAATQPPEAQSQGTKGTPSAVETSPTAA